MSETEKITKTEVIEAVRTAMNEVDFNHESRKRGYEVPPKRAQEIAQSAKAMLDLYCQEVK